jgi:curved DNA-binding protein CbpA
MSNSTEFKSTVEKITWARNLLELPETATFDQINQNFKRLIKQWHPDRCSLNPEKCEEMAGVIIAANEILRDYCRQYKFSFSDEEIKKYLSHEEWWLEKFGTDPLWSGNDQKNNAEYQKN